MKTSGIVLILVLLLSLNVNAYTYTQFPSQGSCPVLTNNLRRGSAGNDVTKLQKFLSNDKSVYPEGLVSGYFGPLTEKAVQKWQSKQGVVSSGTPGTTGYGVVGTKTRARINSLCVSTILPEQSSDLPLSKIMQYVPQKFHNLLQSPRINTSIARSGPISEAEILFLRDKILELESGNTISWDSHRYTGSWSQQNLREVWLKQVALSLYVEANKIVSWSILSFNDRDLDSLLAFSRTSESDPILTQLFIINHNPLISYGFVRKELLRLDPYSVDNQRMLLESIIVWMREGGWGHVAGSPSLWQDRCGIWNPDIQCLLEVKLGASGLNAYFLRSILASHNVPSEVISMWNHGGIIFPTLSIGMNGDEVQSSFTAGLIEKPNKIPIENTFLKLDWLQKMLTLPLCQGYREITRKYILMYLNLLDDPQWRGDIAAAYNFTPGGTYGHGKWLRERIVEDTFPSDCQRNDSSAPNYWVQPLSEEEIDFWLERIRMVVSPPTLTLTSPNGGEQLLINNTYEIKWSGNLEKIWLLPPDVNGKIQYAVARKIYDTSGRSDSSGSYLWKITDEIIPRNYFMYIEGSYNNIIIVDASDAFFAIK